MRAAPTPAELHAALARIRALPRCAAWPAELPAVLADPVRARLVRIEAIRPHPPARQPAHGRPASRPAMPVPLPAVRPAFDIKRAAAGDRDD